MTHEKAKPLVGAIEAGGTKFVAAVGTGPDDLTRMEFPTVYDPGRVLNQVTGWLLEQQHQKGALQAVGIGSFGPIDLHKGSPTYGFITSTPKPGWKDTNMVGAVEHVFPDVPVAFDTDVNAAAFGEHRWGQGRSLKDFVYITIGTGIGAGGMVGGSLMHGLVHPEIGHMLLPKQPGDDFVGVCEYHYAACWEGLCSGPALAKRYGRPVRIYPQTMLDGSWRPNTPPTQWQTLYARFHPNESSSEAV